MPSPYVDDDFAWPDSVDPRVVAYLEGSLGDAQERGIADWRGLRIVPRILRDVTRVSTEFCQGDRLFASPIVIAPWASQTFVHPDGEIATSRGAAAAGVPIVLSSNSATPVSDLPADGASFWSQLYIPPRRDDILPFVRASEEAGALGFVVTVDAPSVPLDFPFREGIRDIAPPSVNFAGGVMPPIAADLGPRDFEWLREVSGLPVFAKGVLSPADARLLVDGGASGVIVSNHGGRQLGGVVTTSSVLPSIVDEVAGAVPVWVDSGIRSGDDVFRALALGADAVLVGRPAARALTGGALGVTALLQALRFELHATMAMCGCASLPDITRSHLQLA